MTKQCKACMTLTQLITQATNGKTFTLDNVYDSPYGNLFDELNMLVDTIQ